MDYKSISFLLSGSRRLKLLKSLSQTPKTPTQLAAECSIKISNISPSLSELKNKELVICINPESHTYKFFKITDKGKQALDDLKVYKDTRTK